MEEIVDFLRKTFHYLYHILSKKGWVEFRFYLFDIVILIVTPSVFQAFLIHFHPKKSRKNRIENPFKIFCV
jgi:hypothetical protein